MFRGAYTPEQTKESMILEFDRLYLEKCQEVNELERKVEKYKSMAEIAVKQKAEIREHLEEAKQTIREMEKPPLTGDLISRGAALKAVSDAQMTLFNLPLKAMKYADEILSQIEYRKKVTLELIEAIPAASTIRELAAEPLKGFIPDVEAPEELPEELLVEPTDELFEELPLWRLQPTTSQDILCLSSALKNLHDIHKCDSFVLYNKLARGLEKKIDHYFGED